MAFGEASYHPLSCELPFGGFFPELAHFELLAISVKLLMTCLGVLFSIEISEALKSVLFNFFD
jgi:hypothetical protein